VVRARIDAGAYSVVRHPASENATSADEPPLASRAAVAGAPVLVSLVLTEAGWRIDDVGAAP
jgi:hypothetical protein